MNSLSMDVHEPSIDEDPTLNQLRNSLNLVEKDLGINAEVDQYRSGISSVIQRSMVSLTPIHKNKMHNDSIVSDISLSIDIENKELVNINENKKE